MKTYASYGFGIALAGALLSLVFFFLGYHNDPVKLQTASSVSMWLGLAISVLGLVLGIRAKRDEVSEDEPFGYGTAFFAGFMISLFSAIFSTIYQAIYISVINPAFLDTMRDQQQIEMAKNGMTAEQIEQAEKFMGFFTSELFISGATLIFGIIFGVFLTSIVAIFLRRKGDLSQPPPLAS